MQELIRKVFKAARWSKYQWIFFLIVMSLFTGPMVFTFYEQNTLGLNDWLISLTGFVVLIYTIETQGLRSEMVRQNEIALKPFVIMGIHHKKWNNHIFLKNIGRGAALFVRIEDVVLGKVAGDLAAMRDRVVNDVATFSEFNYIESGQEVGFQALCATDARAGSIYLDFLPSIDPDTAQDNYELTLNYQDVEGDAHRTKMRIGKDGVELLKPTS